MTLPEVFRLVGPFQKSLVLVTFVEISVVLIWQYIYDIYIFLKRWRAACMARFLNFFMKPNFFL